MIERLKYLGTILGNAAVLGFLHFQLYCAWSRGEVFSGPPTLEWVSHGDDPAWFLRRLMHVGTRRNCRRLDQIFLTIVCAVAW
jgi:hypothetical protein